MPAQTVENGWTTSDSESTRDEKATPADRYQAESFPIANTNAMANIVK